MARSRRAARDPDVKRRTEELQLKVRITRDLVDEINATAVALDVFRQLKRHRMLDDPRSQRVI